VDRIRSKVLDDASSGEDDVLNRLVVRQHGKNGVASAGA